MKTEAVLLSAIPSKSNCKNGAGREGGGDGGGGGLGGGEEIEG